MSTPHQPPPAPTGRAARVAIVIPIFGHPVLMVQAVDSALSQQAPFPIHTILVNDGCPLEETDAVCREFAAAHPDRVTYLRKPNGGLSDARNHGIRWALANLAAVEALFMLDADNALRPHAMARALAILDADPQADWVYPDVDMLNLGRSAAFGGPYSVLLHTRENLCEAGSLIHRRVFDAGVWFDTGFREGFEDWDFFLSAAGRGFRGRNLETFGFLYRKRPESMLSAARRRQPEIVDRLRRKHAALLSAVHLLALEQEEAPRHAIVLADTGRVLLTTDPGRDGQDISAEAFDRLVWSHRVAPGRHAMPAFVSVSTLPAMAALRGAGMLHWTFWQMESACDAVGAASLHLTDGAPDRLAVAWEPNAAGGVPEAQLVMQERGRFLDVISPEVARWSGRPAPEDLSPPRALEISLPASGLGPCSSTGAVAAQAALIRKLGASPYRAATTQRWDWRDDGLKGRATAHEIPRMPYDGAPAYPRLRDGRGHIGFVLPLVAFGGVEKVALNIAVALKARGWVPHLFVVGDTEAALGPIWRKTFESVNFLCDPAFDLWRAGEEISFGTALPDWGETGAHGRALSMLGWLDVAINFHGAAISGIMGALRTLGVHTAVSLHLNDRTQVGRPVGNAFLGVAYEHGYDLVLPCSHQLGEWCHAMGVPSEKIVPVPNAASFDAGRDRLEATQSRRRKRPKDAPLRALFLGRLDWQKGLDRLDGCISGAASAGIAIEWRVIGKAVMEGGLPVPASVAARAEPPIDDPEALLDAYGWADILVLLSGYEGLPLTIIEAMRSGTVPVATDVGAVSEVVRDGENGILLPLDDAVPTCIVALASLSGDRTLLQRLSDRAFRDMRDRTWESATADLHARLLSLPAKRPD